MNHKTGYQWQNNNIINYKLWNPGIWLVPSILANNFSHFSLKRWLLKRYSGVVLFQSPQLLKPDRFIPFPSHCRISHQHWSHCSRCCHYHVHPPGWHSSWSMWCYLWLCGQCTIWTKHGPTKCLNKAGDSSLFLVHPSGGTRRPPLLCFCTQQRPRHHTKCSSCKTR